MKRIILFLGIAWMVCNMQAQVIVTVDASQKKQTVRGMGCQDDLESAGRTNDDLLYDIGASSYRAFAGENSEEGFNEPVNDNSDPNNLDLSKITGLSGNRLVAYQKAARRGCVFYLTVGSPPAWQKTNNSCCNGGSLRSDMYEEFAEFVLGVAKKFKEQTGVDLYAVSIQNEPEFAEPYYSCVYTKDSYYAAAKAVATKLRTNGLPTKLAYGEQTFAQGNYISWASLANNDPDLTKDICALAIHSYDSDPFGGGAGLPYQWVAYYKEANRVAPAKEVWMSEGGTTGTTIDAALGAALQFYNSFKYGNATLFSHRYLGRTSSPANYYGIKNMVRYIRPGAYRLQTSCSDTVSVLALAFKHDGHGSYTVYLVNRASSDKSVTVNWAGVTGTFDIFRTSATDNCEWEGQTTLSNSILLPAKSITTLVCCSSNKLPTINPVDTVVIIKGTGSRTVMLSGISNGGESGQPVIIKAWTREGAAALLSNITVSYTSPNSSGSITLTPSGTEGNTEVLVSLNDKSLAMDSMFNEKVISIPVYVIPYINKPPTMNPVSDQQYPVSYINTTQTILLTGVSDGNDGKQKLTLTATSSAPWIATVSTVGATMVKITPKAEGTVTITLTLSDNGVNVGGGVGVTQQNFKVVIGSGVNGMGDVRKGFSVYPVPARDRLTVTVEEEMSVQYEIRDITGHLWLNGVIREKVNGIDVSSLSPGLYVLRLTTSGRTFTQQILIE